MVTKALSNFNRPCSGGGRILQLLSVVISFIASGCGSGTPHGVSIQGRVTYQGQPVESGTMTFSSLGSALECSGSANIEKGCYALLATEGMKPGAYRIQIEGYRKTGRKIPDLATPLPPNQERAMIDERIPYLPPKFNEDSNLQVEIATDGQELNFDLQ